MAKVDCLIFSNFQDFLLGADGGMAEWLRAGEEGITGWKPVLRRSCFRGDECGKLIGRALQEFLPVVVGSLTDQFHRRIPGAVFAVEHPAPVGREVEQHPRRDS